MEPKGPVNYYTGVSPISSGVSFDAEAVDDGDFGRAASGRGREVADAGTSMDVEETTALLSSPANNSSKSSIGILEPPLLLKKLRCCQCCYGRRCLRVWKTLLDPQFIKIVLLFVIFIAVVVLFTRFDEVEPETNLHAITSTQPYVLNLTDVPYVNVMVTAQEVDASFGKVWIKAQVISGQLCAPSSLAGRLRVLAVNEIAKYGFSAPPSARLALDNSSFPSEPCTLQEWCSTTHTTTVTDLFGLDASVVSQVVVSTNSPQPLAITVQTELLGGVVGYQVIIAAIVLVCVYILIIFEIVHRTIAAMIGAFVSLAVLSNIRARPSFEEVMTWVDWETCGLLFGMMVMVGIFSTTGFFEYSAVRMYKFSRGHLWRLVALMCIFTAIVSAFLDNVTTILLVAPVTMQLCRVLDVDPVPVVISLVLFSNIGGTATAVGDPPNILLVSDSRIISHVSEAVNFGTMTVHLLPGAILCVVVTFFIVRWQFHAQIERKANFAKEHELQIWKKTVARIAGTSPEEAAVREQLQRHIAQLEQELRDERDSGSGNMVKEVDISELEHKYIIRDWPLFINSSLVLVGVILLFFLHSFVEIHLKLAWIAIIGAMVLLIVSGVRDIEPVLEHVEWATLIFFAGLFIMMQAMERLGLISYIGVAVSNAIATVPPGGSGRLAAAVTVIVWVSGVASAFIDNIPFTAAMIPVVLALASPPLNLPLGPLVWALAFGACLGGNGTLVGASANVVAAGLLDAAGFHLTFKAFFVRGALVTAACLFVANVYLLIFHVAIPWY